MTLLAHSRSTVAARRVAIGLVVGFGLAALVACTEDSSFGPGNGAPLTQTPADAGGDAGGRPPLATTGDLAIATSDALTAFSGQSITLHGAIAGGAGPYQVAWRQTSGNARITLGNDDTLTPSFEIPVVTAPDELGFTVTVIDAAGRFASSGMVVNAIPSAIVVETAERLVVGDDTVAMLSAVASGDLDGASFVWSQTSGTPALTIANPSSPATAVTIPPLLLETSFGLELRVTNQAGVVVTKPVKLDVRPEGPIVSAGVDTLVSENTSFALSGHVRGGTGPYQLAWTQTSGKVVTLTNANTAVPSFTAPDVDADTTLTFELAAIDATGRGSRETVSVRVLATVTGELFANAGPNDSARSGDRIQLAGVGIGGVPPYTFAWTQDSGPAVTLETGASSPGARFFTAPSVVTRAEVGFTLVVTDGANVKKTSTVTLAIDPASLEVQAGADLVARGGDVVRLAGSTRAEVGARTFAWTQTDGPSVVLSGASTPAPSFVAPAVTADTNLVFRLTAADTVTSGTDSVTVVVRPEAPFAVTAVGDAPVSAGAAVFLGALGAGGLGPYRFGWTQTSGTPVSLVDANGKNPHIRFPFVAVDETATFQVSARDARGRTATDEVRFTVKAPAAAANAAGPENKGTAYRPLTDDERSVNECSGPSCLTGGTSVVCDDRAPFALTTIKFNGKGTLTITKSCVDNATCLREWWNTSKPTDTCSSLLPPGNTPVSAVQYNGDPVTCSYCCIGPGCNVDILPRANTTAQCDKDVCYPPR